MSKSFETTSDMPGRSGLERILTIDRLIRDKQYPNAGSIAERFEVSQRTVFDDVRYMRSHMQAPIKFDRNHGGWCYDEKAKGFFLPSIFLTEGDMLAAFIGIEVAERYAGTPYESMLKKALDKVARLFPDTVSLQLDQFASFAIPPSLTVDEEKLVELYSAIQHYRPVKMTYFTASSGKTNQRQVDPYHLHHFNGEWYLIAMDTGRGEMRTFNVGRIQELCVLHEQRFNYPSGFNVKEWLKNSFGIEIAAETHQVCIRFDAAQARYIRERRWHPDQQIEDQPDGGLLLQFPASGLGEVLRWVMKYGSHAEVLQPAILREMVHDEAKRMSQLYTTKISKETAP